MRITQIFMHIKFIETNLLILIGQSFLFSLAFESSYVILVYM